MSCQLVFVVEILRKMSRQYQYSIFTTLNSSSPHHGIIALSSSQKITTVQFCIMLWVQKLPKSIEYTSNKLGKRHQTKNRQVIKKRQILDLSRQKFKLNSITMLIKFALNSRIKFEEPEILLSRLKISCHTTGILTVFRNCY